MITKELLSEVLKVKIQNCKVIDITYELEGEFDPCIKIDYETVDSEGLLLLNIYELSNLCKEWALEQGYYLRAIQGVNYEDRTQWSAFLNKDMNDGAQYVEWWNCTETEAVFKACQWILDNKDN